MGDSGVWALVKNTGFQTTKGTLVRDILYPKQIKFKFYADSLRFVAIMAALAVIGNLVAVPAQVKLGVPVKTIVDRTLDLITITVPPILPAAMSIGINFALVRLKRKANIFCISPPRVNMAGQINTFVFDKTGTLTEEGLSVLGYRPTTVSVLQEWAGSGNEELVQAIFSEFTPDVSKLAATSPEGEPWWLQSRREAKPYQSQNKALLLEAMASCTSITFVDGVLVGDPLDVSMFKSTGWVFDEGGPANSLSDQMVIAFVHPPDSGHQCPSEQVPFVSSESSDSFKNNFESSQEDDEEEPSSPYQLAILRRFEFSSTLQRMSVVCRDTNESQPAFKVFVKGSPEKICELCLPYSLPPDY